MIWNQYLIYHNNTSLGKSVHAYKAEVNDDGSMYKMNFGSPDILFDNTYLFNRELKYLEHLKKYDFLPEIEDIDYINKAVIFKWYKNSINQLFYQQVNLSSISDDWYEQLKNIVKTLDTENLYKANLNPHCFYFDNKNKLRMFDLYGCIDKNDYLLDLSMFKDIIGQQSIHRWQEAIVGEKINFKIFSLRAMEQHIAWPNDALKRLYNELYSDIPIV
jgi:hypothetical protein